MIGKRGTREKHINIKKKKKTVCSSSYWTEHEEEDSTNGQDYQCIQKDPDEVF